jgi:hypothetical protein
MNPLIGIRQPLVSGDVTVGMTYENNLTVEIAGLFLKTDDIGQLSEDAQVVFDGRYTSIGRAGAVAALAWRRLERVSDCILCGFQDQVRSVGTTVLLMGSKVYSNL